MGVRHFRECIMGARATSFPQDKNSFQQEEGQIGRSVIAWERK